MRVYNRVIPVIIIKFLISFMISFFFKLISFFLRYRELLILSYLIVHLLILFLPVELLEMIKFPVDVYSNRVSYAAEEEFVCRDGVCFKRSLEYKPIFDKNQFKEPIIHQPSVKVEDEKVDQPKDSEEPKETSTYTLVKSLVLFFLLLGLLVDRYGKM